MKTVRNFDQYYADIVADGQKQLAEVLRLFRCLTAEHSAADFRQTAYDLRDLVAEQTGYVLHRVIGVFHYVV